jgi:hypothetical protein
MAALADSLARIAARVNGVRGRALYPPFAALGKRLRSVSRKLRGGGILRRHQQQKRDHGNRR